MIIRKKYKAELHRGIHKGTVIEEIYLTKEQELKKVFKELDNLGYKWRNGEKINDDKTYINTFMTWYVVKYKKIKLYLLSDKTVLFD
ncbi:hypothetical protein P7A61_04155 [Clostridium perfringens]|nr:hypothetical protein [Clostridium perfringens]